MIVPGTEGFCGIIGDEIGPGFRSDNRGGEFEGDGVVAACQSPYPSNGEAATPSMMNRLPQDCRVERCEGVERDSRSKCKLARAIQSPLSALTRRN